MEGGEDDSTVKPPLTGPPPPPPHRSLTFVEVMCNSSGSTRRFAAGTEAGFALNLINKKLVGNGFPRPMYIEAVKEGEESVCFGPTAVLVDYGPNWKLQTVIRLQGPQFGERIQLKPTISQSEMDLGDLHLAKSTSQPLFSFSYIGKILVAFILIFVLGAIFTVALENLPRLILYLNSLM